METRKGTQHKPRSALPSQENKKLAREEFEHPPVDKINHKKKFNSKNSVINAWKETQLNIIENSKFFTFREFLTQLSGWCYSLLKQKVYLAQTISSVNIQSCFLTI